MAADDRMQRWYELWLQKVCRSPYVDGGQALSDDRDVAGPDGKPDTHPATADLLHLHGHGDRRLIAAGPSGTP